ncbi:tRNA (guanosine(46)-N7)-methyltransferase TrmB [Wolbachia endosymbiont (group E) of Neria commutata]|uniref:tRNA (guanosine(46)-N7)-methyltransferase TrmB n=1 Tax=Wolbachia endosymbiont (group E) of Neria commutata TaxID=3066149 RepID=UPI003132FC88
MCIKNMLCKWIRSFSRRSRLKPEVDETLKQYSIQNNKESIENVVNSQKRIWVEIGFGSGENMLYQALNESDLLFIGCEPYLKGVSKLLSNIEKHNIKNILIWTEDARELIENFPDNSVERFFILFPDPWPKRSHNKRRLINTEFLNLLAKKMLMTGEILIATDHPDYAEWIALHIKQCNFLSYRETDFSNCPFTKYHKKALKYQRKVRFFKISISLKQSTVT